MVQYSVPSKDQPSWPQNHLTRSNVTLSQSNICALHSLHHHLDLTNSFDIAVFAVACVMFWCCCRLCELLIDTTFDPASHVSQSTLIKHGVAANSSAFTSFHLPCTKTKEDGDDVRMTDTHCDCSLSFAFNHHLSSNSSVPGNSPLFTFETEMGGWSPMRHNWFLARCNEVWA